MWWVGGLGLWWVRTSNRLENWLHFKCPAMVGRRRFLAFCRVGSGFSGIGLLGRRLGVVRGYSSGGI